MKILFTSFLFLSLVSGMAQSLWDKNFIFLEMSKIVYSQKIKREALFNAIDMATYASLGFRRRLQRHGSALIDSEFVSNKRLDDHAQEYPVKASKSFSKIKNRPPFIPDTARIDLCSTLLEDNDFFVECLQRLLNILYGEDPIFISLKKKRPFLEKELFVEVREALKKALGWDSPDILSQIERLRPDTSWLLSLELPSPELNNLFHNMLRMKSTKGGYPQSLMYYVSIHRWHPGDLKFPKVHLAAASKPLIEAMIGRELSDLIEKKIISAFDDASFESIEEDSYTGRWKLVKPLVLEKIFLESCSQLGIDQSKLDNFLDFSRFPPPKQEWLLDLVEMGSGSRLGWKVMKRPFF
ncbi:hypothetical protein [Candidatus Similichlamydia epinepheli]|uniref:hypothetical protein n=1 Tax=Candidatus Similichlamydia epinepheli TaxID=1903953 RepID=UPI0013009856|nr:hypothetical protein [Candidatus Similichlamydia epinepheli]